MMLPRDVFPPESWSTTADETAPTRPAKRHPRVARVDRLDGGAVLYVVRFQRPEPRHPSRVR